MDRLKASYVNIIASVFQQIISIVFGFISRMLFIHILGVEILGLNNTFESILGTLALADLGIGRAITYSLYKPFQNHDYKKINSVIAIYKAFYRIVAIIIFIGSLICIPFLPKIITGFEFKTIFVGYFILLSINSASSYLLAYKRVLFYVDQKDYVTKIIDAVSSILFLTLKIVVLSVTGSYFGYLLIQIVQTVTSNISVHWLCTKKYPYIASVAIEKNLFRTIWADMKDIIFGKLASFVYDSTDNLVISTFVSTVMVGMLGSYVLITSSIKKIINSIVNPFAPIIGGMIAGGDVDAKQKSFELCTQFCFVVAIVLLVPAFGLIDSFIVLWIGTEYLMAVSISLLLMVDLFVFTMQGICCSYIFGEGLFKYEKNIDIITALMNLSTSIILARFIGVAGVLIGTVISESFMWLGRSYVVYFFSIKTGRKGFIKYWLINIVRVILFGAAGMIARFIGSLQLVDSAVLNLIINGLLIEASVLVIYLIVFGWSPINKQLFILSFKALRGRKK